MDEREPEERPDETRSAEAPEANHNPGISEVDSARPSSGAAGHMNEQELTPSGGLEEPLGQQAREAAELHRPEEDVSGSSDEVAAAEGSESAAEAVADQPDEAADRQPEAPSVKALTPAQEHRAAAAEGLRRGRLPQGDAAVDGGGEPAWYVVHCYSGYENKVRHNLEQRIETMGMKDRIFDVVIPTQEEIEVREGKRRTVERHIFPGYVLVNMTLSEESWYVVRNTPGVTGFVGMGNLPTPLRPEEVAQIIKRMESEAPAVKVSFKPGERVRIIDGPFNDFRGTVANLDMEHNKVRVMVSFFGRETPVELDFLQVEKA